MYDDDHNLIMFQHLRPSIIFSHVIDMLTHNILVNFSVIMLFHHSYPFGGFSTESQYSFFDLRPPFLQIGTKEIVFQ